MWRADCKQTIVHWFDVTHVSHFNSNCASDVFNFLTNPPSSYKYVFKREFSVVNKALTTKKFTFLLDRDSMIKSGHKEKCAYKTLFGCLVYHLLTLWFVIILIHVLKDRVHQTLGLDDISGRDIDRSTKQIVMGLLFAGCYMVKVMI